MLLNWKSSSILTRQILRRHCCRALSSPPSNNTLPGTWQSDDAWEPRALPRVSVENPTGPKHAPPTALPPALQTLRTADGLAVSIRNIAPEVPICEVLDIVLGGPLFHVDDSVQNGSRVITLTFYHLSGARAFFNDATSREIDIHGRQPQFSLTTGTAPKWNSHLSRSIVIWDQGRLGTIEDISNYMYQYGPVDRVALMKEKGADRAFVNFLSAVSGARAAEELRKAGAEAYLVNDRCLVTANFRTLALKTQSRTVKLLGIPRQTPFSELCDQIRGGALHRINYTPEEGVAFVHFVEHDSAAYFFQHVVYQGIILRRKRLSAVFLEKSEKLATFMREHVELGATRCLGIQGVLNPDMLRNDCLRYGNIERMTFSESMSVVSFTNIQQAVRASRMLPSKVGYMGLKMTFMADPCAEPYVKDMDDAAALQAEVASLLVPSRESDNGVRPPSDDDSIQVRYGTDYENISKRFSE
ncbi:hypothetical protein DFH06DRAFT_1182919 [Mycena polygramma]|nr:hypothetical protein DFH06DRAFT_1182919 [Mycena polygramma]